MTDTAMIGLGMMGQGMARNILAAGIPLRGFDLSQDARARFAAAGGVAAETAAAAAAGCDLLLVMVQTAPQARAALFDSGAAAALAPGAVVVLSSTVAPGDVRALADDLAALGHALVDAPVSGGQVGADNGTLTIMASGAPDAMARAMPLLEAVSKKVWALGDAPGLGATYKVVHQLAAGVHVVVAGELMAMGAAAGCDPRTLLEIVTTSAGASWMLADRGPRMLQPTAVPTSSVDIFIKDLGLVVKTAADCGASVPVAEAALAMMKAAGDMGLGPEDDSSVVRAYEARSGRKVHES